MQINPLVFGAELSGLGSFVDVSTATSADPYTFTADGYLTASANGASSYIQTKLVGSNGNTVDFYVAGASAINIISTYVRKGMKFYVSDKSGSTLARFTPFV